MRYRFRTAVLVGGWRSTAKAAGEDAIRARQADLGADRALRWRVVGRLEASETPDILNLRISKTA